MKIIKEFEDREFFNKLYSWIKENDLINDHFYWGLGEDGELYCYCTRFADNDEWHIFYNISNIEEHISLRVMKRIVKEFGHLLAFL